MRPAVETLRACTGGVPAGSSRGGLAGGWRSAGYEYLAGPFQQETPLAGRDASRETDCWWQLAGQIGGETLRTRLRMSGGMRYIPSSQEACAAS